MAIGAFDDARRSLAMAAELGEWDADLTINRGLIERELGSIERARDFWDEVIRLGQGHKTKQAAELLAKTESPQKSCLITILPVQAAGWLLQKDAASS